MEVNQGSTINKTTGDGYLNLAAAIVKSAVDSNDQAFFGQQWGKTLCQCLGVDTKFAVDVAKEKYEKRMKANLEYYYKKKLEQEEKAKREEEARKKREQKELDEIEHRKNTIYKHPIMCVETGIIYPTAHVAEASVGVDHCNILRCCRGQRETCGGYHWKYAERY